MFIPLGSLHLPQASDITHRSTTKIPLETTC